MNRILVILITSSTVLNVALDLATSFLPTWIPARSALQAAGQSARDPGDDVVEVAGYLAR